VIFRGAGLAGLLLPAAIDKFAQRAVEFAGTRLGAVAVPVIERQPGAIATEPTIKSPVAQ